MRFAELVVPHVSDTKAFFCQLAQHASEVSCPLGLERYDDVGRLLRAGVPVKRVVSKVSEENE